MTTSNKPKQGFAPIIIILAIVVALGLGGYYLSKQNKSLPSPIAPIAETTDGWESYTNTKYGYSIKYPATLTPTEIMETSADPIYLHKVEFKVPKIQSISGITVEVRNFTSLRDEITYRKWQVVGHLADKIDSEEPVTVAGLPGTMLNYWSGEDKLSITIVPYQKFVYTITAQSNQLDLYNQLLSSFKLLDKAIDKTANWQTYTNSKNNFSFKYPETWILKQYAKNVIEDPTTRSRYLVIDEQGSMSNECAEKYESTKVVLSENTFEKSMYRGVVQGKMCTNPENLAHREIWLKLSTNSSLGIQYIYDVGAETESLAIFDQILSTFKFTQ